MGIPKTMVVSILSKSQWLGKPPHRCREERRRTIIHVFQMARYSSRYLSSSMPTMQHMGSISGAYTIFRQALVVEWKLRVPWSKHGPWGIKSSTVGIQTQWGIFILSMGGWPSPFIWADHPISKKEGIIVNVLSHELLYLNLSKPPCLPTCLALSPSFDLGSTHAGVIWTFASQLVAMTSRENHIVCDAEIRW